MKVCIGRMKVVFNKRKVTMTIRCIISFQVVVSCTKHLEEVNERTYNMHLTGLKAFILSQLYMLWGKIYASWNSSFGEVHCIVCLMLSYSLSIMVIFVFYSGFAFLGWIVSCLSYISSYLLDKITKWRIRKWYT